MTIASDPDLVGREPELRAVETLLENARDGRSGSLFVIGEPGIGKTAVLKDTVEAAKEFTTVSTRAIEAESELSFAGLVDVLRPLTGHLDAIVPRQRAALEGALGLGPPTAADPLGVSAAALALFASAADERPVLVAVDDFHWLDAPSQLVLVFVARRLQAERVAMVVAARELPAAFAHAALPTLLLTPLVERDALALLRSRAPSAAPDVTDAILATAGGNPLAILELAAFLDDDQLAGRVSLRGPLPVNGPVEAAFADLLAHLDADAGRLLLVAAADDTADPRVVLAASALLGVGEETRREVESSGVLVLGTPVRFRHPILRSIVYHTASEDDRRAAHAAIASALPDDTYRRAWHLGCSTVGPDDDAASLLAGAATDARARQRYSSAAAAEVEAARLTASSEDRCRHLLAAAADSQLYGNFARADRCVDDVLALSADPSVRGEALRIRGQGMLVQGRWTDAVPLLSREGELLADRAPDVAAILLSQATLCCQPLGRIDEGLVLGGRAVEIAEHAGPAAQLTASLAYAEILALRGDAQHVTALLARARAVAPLDDPMVAGMVLQSEAGYMVVVGRHDEARAATEQVVVAARQAGAAAVLPYPLGLLAEIQLRSGYWPDALAAASEAVELAEQTGQVTWGLFALQALVRLEAAIGRKDAATAHAHQAQAVADTFGIEGMRFYLPTARAFAALTHGDLEAAVDHGREVEQISRERGLGEPAVVLWAPDLVEAYARLGRHDDAAVVLERFSGEAKTTQRTWALAATGRCAGLLQDDFEAPFAEALAWHEQVAMPFERARTELCLGERRRRAGRRSDARAPLRSALHAFERLGAAPWADRARSELVATGERARRREAVTGQLTPHELRVALVVARGSTNKEAAAELFVSPKTIDFHLRGVYRKLGVRSRSELARLIARESLSAEG